MIKKSISQLLILLLLMSPVVGAMAGELMESHQNCTDCDTHSNTGDPALCQVDCALAICTAFHVPASGLMGNSKAFNPALVVSVVYDDLSAYYLSRPGSLVFRPPKS